MSEETLDQVTRDGPVPGYYPLSPYDHGNKPASFLRDRFFPLLGILFLIALLVLLGLSGPSEAEREERRRAELAKIEAHQRLVKACKENRVDYSPDEILKGVVPEGRKSCSRMYVFITRYDTQGGRCSFEGRISNQLSRDVHDYSLNSFFGYPTSMRHQIDNVKNCPDLDGVDIYDTVSLYAYYDGTFRVRRKITGSGGFLGDNVYCYDIVPLFRIVEVELQKKETIADIALQVETLKSDVFSYCD